MIQTVKIIVILYHERVDFTDVQEMLRNYRNWCYICNRRFLYNIFNKHECMWLMHKTEGRVDMLEEQFHDKRVW